MVGMAGEATATVGAPELLEVRDAHRLPALIAARASALAGCPVAVYVVDIDGSYLLHLAGETLKLPGRFSAPLAVGTELPVDAITAVGELVARAAPEMVVVPLVVRDRAVGVLIAAEAPHGPLQAFASEAALALEMACGYTDVVHAARRRRSVDPAAEIQQNLLPPRIATVSGYRVAGGVLPGYEIGGDFFDYADNPEGLWLAVGDAVGKGNRAAALSSLALGALRTARRGGATLPEAAELIHDTICGYDHPQYLTAVVAICHPDGTFRWISAGHPYPLHITQDGAARELTDGHTHPLGLYAFDRDLSVGHARLAAGEQVVLYSDGVTDRKLAAGGRLGPNAITELLRDDRPPTPSATVRALHSLVIDASTEPLHDDATVLATARLPLTPAA